MLADCISGLMPRARSCAMIALKTLLRWHHGRPPRSPRPLHSVSEPAQQFHAPGCFVRPYVKDLFRYPSRESPRAYLVPLSHVLLTRLDYLRTELLGVTVLGYLLDGLRLANSSWRVCSLCMVSGMRPAMTEKSWATAQQNCKPWQSSSALSLF